MSSNHHTNEHLPHGVMGADYHKDRLKSPGPRYRLKRRAMEAARIIVEHAVPHPRILDIGTADGLQLDLIAEQVQPRFTVGIELSWELLRLNIRKFPVVRANGLTLPFQPESFDAVVATAVIEHVDRPHDFVAEIRRVLHPAGICVLTTPDPFFEEIASRLGFLSEDDHQETFPLEKLANLLASQEFQILEAEKFMMSPIGFPAEVPIERIMKKIGLGKLMMNQIVAGRKEK